MRRWLGLLPLAVGAAAAIVVVLSGLDRWLVLSARVWLVLLVVGALASAAWFGVAALLSRGRRRIAEAEARVRDEERLARRRFMRRLDHELKNPVTAIRTALASEGEGSPALQVAGAQARRLGALVGDLAKLADLETRALESEPVDLRSLVDEVLEALPPADRRISVEFPDVPWPVPPVVGDRDLLGVALFNLVGNAVKYSDDGARIEIRAAEADGVVSLEVNDHGWGIDGEALPQVWEELARGRHPRPVEGSGLGLSIVRVIAARHGGSAELRSEPGVGTRVVLRLPSAEHTR
ncbi:MAG: HAMP domain-containing sensor histidine kinase [Arachnia sp.]